MTDKERRKIEICAELYRLNGVKLYNEETKIFALYDDIQFGDDKACREVTISFKRLDEYTQVKVRHEVKEFIQKLNEDVNKSLIFKDASKVVDLELELKELL